MRHDSRLGALVLAALACFGATARGEEQAASARTSFELGVDAYRAGEYDKARSLWTTALEERDGTEVDRAALLYDLGNATARMGRWMEAVGWYTAALRSEPRNADAWSNLEFARREAKLEPADRGDLRATLERLAGAFTSAEAGWIAVAFSTLTLLALAWEAIRGGRLARRLAILSACLAFASLIPWGYARSRERPGGLLVVHAEGAGLLSEPRAQAAALATLPAASEVRRRDAIAGWVQVEDAAGERGWVREDALFDLSR